MPCFSMLICSPYQSCSIVDVINTDSKLHVYKLGRQVNLSNDLLGANRIHKYCGKWNDNRQIASYIQQVSPRFCRISQCDFCWDCGFPLRMTYLFVWETDITALRKCMPLRATSISLATFHSASRCRNPALDYKSKLLLINL